MAEIAQEFWRRVGAQGPLDLPLEEAALYSLPLTIQRTPRLSSAHVRHFLRSLGLARRLEDDDRPLHAALVVWGGRGRIFLDAADPPAEQLYSLAHEVAHFLLEYQRPRELAASRLGDAILQVLDGQRPATVTERLDSLLARVPLGLHLHLMERYGRLLCPRDIPREERADRLALELLAPAGQVWSLLRERGGGRSLAGSLRAVERLLMDSFGLPAGLAREYGEWIVRCRLGGPSVREWLDGREGAS
ncbi:hypothetical protein HRbin25_00585 [bacterium HR25]|nr:hypothetical protein HRbin25_00585 [bacterium HR25]